MNQALSPDVSEAQLRSRSIQGGAATLVAQGVKFVLSFGSQIFLARLLVPAEFGLIAMVMPVLGFVQVFSDLGLMQAVVQRPIISERQLNAIFWINIGFSVALCVGFVLLAPVLAWIYGDSRVVGVTVVLASLLIVTGTSQLQGALMSRHLRFVELATVEAASSCIGAVVGVLAAWWGAGYWSLVLNQIGSSVTNAILLWALAKWRPSRPARDPEVMPMLRFGGHITGANLAGYLNTSVDNVMIGAVIGEVGLGLYDRAWKLVVQPLTQITAPVDRLAVSVLARLHSDAARYQGAYVQMLQILLFIALPGLLFALIMSKPLILMLFGAKWEDTVPVFFWVCLGALISPVNLSTFWLFVSQGRAKQQMRSMIVVSLINVAAYAVGLCWGVVGVAKFSALSVYLLQTPFLVAAATREGPVNLRLLLRALAPFVLSTVIATAALEALSSAWPADGLWSLSAMLLTSYLFAVVSLAFVPAGRAVLRNLWKMRSVFTHRKALAPGPNPA